jgi:uncharacterized membrane protein
MYGGIGTILGLVWVFVSYVGPLLLLIGVVLVILAVSQISRESGDKKIFSNYLIYFILNIVIGVAAVLIALAIFMSQLPSLENIAEMGQEEFLDVIGPFIVSILVFFVITCVGSIIACYFLKKSYEGIKERTGVDMFGTVGWMYFIGALLTIILIGILVLFIARIFEIVAYFSLPDELPEKRSDAEI